MATIDSPEVIRKILFSNGIFPGDPQLYAVLSYTNDWGNPTFAICASVRSFREAFASPHVHLPQLLWSRDDGLTPAGSLFLNPTGSHEEESE